MNRTSIKVIIPLLSVIAGVAVTQMTSYAKPEYSKKEKTGCITCHVAQGKKELNEVGKCYGEHEHSMAACTPKK